MTRQARRLAGLLLLPTVVLAVALALAPHRAVLEIHVWLLVVLALVLVAFLGAVQAAYPSRNSPFEASLRRLSPAAARPQSLERLEREVSMAGTSAFDLHARLRPGITSLAAELLAARRGIDLAGEPARARAVLGEDAWELVRPDRPAPGERYGPGIDATRLDRVVTALESI